MDTTRFLGVKSVTIYVQFDQPNYQEVRLWVRANGRDDVMMKRLNAAWEVLGHKDRRVEYGTPGTRGQLQHGVA